MTWLLGFVAVVLSGILTHIIYDTHQIIDCAIVKINRANNKNPMYVIGVYKGKSLRGFINTYAINNLIYLKERGYLTIRLADSTTMFIEKEYYDKSTFHTEDLNHATEVYNEIKFIMKLTDNFVRITPLLDEKNLAEKEEKFNKSRELTMKLIEAGKKGNDILELEVLKELEKINEE